VNRFLISLVLLVGCRSEQPTDENRTSATSQIPTVVVTSYALYAMATEVAADAVVVTWSSADAEDPREWKPAPDDLRLLQSADAIFLNGAGYEPWVQNVSLPRSRTIDTSEAYRERLLAAEGTVTHQHGPKGSAAGGDVVPTTWLDPELAINQLRQLERRLKQLIPEAAKQVSSRADALAAKLERIGTALDAVREQAVDRTVSVDSADYDYLIARLGWTSAIMPAADETNAAVRDGDFFFHDVGTKASLESLTERGLIPVAIDLCERPLSTSSLADRMQGNTDRLKALLSAP